MSWFGGCVDGRKKMSDSVINHFGGSVVISAGRAVSILTCLELSLSLAEFDSYVFVRDYWGEGTDDRSGCRRQPFEAGSFIAKG